MLHSTPELVEAAMARSVRMSLAREVACTLVHLSEVRQGWMLAQCEIVRQTERGDSAKVATSQARAMAYQAELHRLELALVARVRDVENGKR